MEVLQIFSLGSAHWGLSSCSCCLLCPTEGCRPKPTLQSQQHHGATWGFSPGAQRPLAHTSSSGCHCNTLSVWGLRDVKKQIPKNLMDGKILIAFSRQQSSASTLKKFCNLFPLKSCFPTDAKVVLRYPKAPNLPKQK